MKRSDLEGKNLGELKKIAKSKKIKGYSKYRKSDIPELINLMLNFKISEKPKRSRSKKSKKPKRSRSKKSKKSKKPKRSRSKKSKKLKRSRSKKSKKLKRSRSKKSKSVSGKSKYSNLVLPGYTKKIGNMKIKELKYFAKITNLKGYSKYKKAELVEFIGKNLNQPAQKDKTPKKYQLPLSKEDVKSMKKSEMVAILKDNGITIGLPQKKSELILE